MSTDNTKEQQPQAPATDEDITIEDLDSVSGGLNVSTIGTAACPVSSLSTLAP